MTDNTEPQLTRRQFGIRSLAAVTAGTALGTPPLHNAVKSWQEQRQAALDEQLKCSVNQQDLLSTKRLIDEGANVNCGNESIPLIHCAARYGNAALISLLALHGADMSAQDNQHRTALHCAVEHAMHAYHSPDRCHATVSAVLDAMTSEQIKMRDVHGRNALTELLQITCKYAEEARKSGAIKRTMLAVQLDDRLSIAELLMQAGLQPTNEECAWLKKMAAIAEECRSRQEYPSANKVQKAVFTPHDQGKASSKSNFQL